MTQFLIGTLLVLSSLFLIALVLIQQGKGGGLAGAFGGMGGQSAFGTKAGDVFTRITIITALVWIFFCMLAIKLIGQSKGPRRSADNPAAATAPLIPGEPAKGTTPGATTPSDTKPGEEGKDDKGSAPATTTPDSTAPATTTPAAPMTPAATTPATPAESSTPAPATPAPATPAPATPATPEGK